MLNRVSRNRFLKRIWQEELYGNSLQVIQEHDPGLRILGLPDPKKYVN